MQVESCEVALACWSQFVLMASAESSSRLMLTKWLTGFSWVLLAVCFTILLASLLASFRTRVNLRVLQQLPNSVGKANRLANQWRNQEIRTGLSHQRAVQFEKQMAQVETEIRNDATRHVIASIWHSSLAANNVTQPSLSFQAMRAFCGDEVTCLIQWVAKTSVMAGMLGTIVGLIGVFAALDGGVPDMARLVPAFQTALTTTACGVPLYIMAVSLNGLVWRKRQRVIKDLLADTVDQVAIYLQLRHRLRLAIAASRRARKRKRRKSKVKRKRELLAKRRAESTEETACPNRPQTPRSESEITQELEKQDRVCVSGTEGNSESIAIRCYDEPYPS